MKPTFLVIGAAKAGTSSLRFLLRQHPDVFMSKPKELHFFSFDQAYAQGVDWYETWFAAADGFRQIGEKSATYTVRKLFPHAAERIRAYAPDMKLIYIARNPLERIESAWLQLRRLGVAPFRQSGVRELPAGFRVDLSFNKAVRLQADIIVESTNYWQEINVYRRLFPDEQILVLLFERFERDQQSVLRRCFEFLDLDQRVELAEHRVHLNSMAQYRLEPGLLWWLWSSPLRRRLYLSARALLPRSMRVAARRLVSPAPVTARPQWDPETRAWVCERLRDDIDRFLDFYGYPRDSWQLS